MRKFIISLASLAACLAMVGPGAAGQFTPSSTTVTGVGAGNSAGSFVGGFMPTNIVNKPIDISAANKPVGYQQAIMPQQQSTKVFNVNSAFRNVQMPLFKSMTPSTPVVQPGPRNPLQPVPLPKQGQTPAAQKKILFGLVPWS